MFEDTKVLARTSHCYARLHRELIEIHEHKNNFNKKEESLIFNKTWFPALRNRKINKGTCNQLGIAKCRMPIRTHGGQSPMRCQDSIAAVTSQTL